MRSCVYIYLLRTKVDTHNKCSVSCYYGPWLHWGDGKFVEVFPVENTNQIKGAVVGEWNLHVPLSPSTDLLSMVPYHLLLLSYNHQSLERGWQVRQEEHRMAHIIAQATDFISLFWDLRWYFHFQQLSGKAICLFGIFFYVFKAWNSERYWFLVMNISLSFPHGLDSLDKERCILALFLYSILRNHQIGNFPNSMMHLYMQ